ncbi:Uncharacterized protein Adt_35229 [Abeliophyllum distichum]|uniref:Uncharacterized protein n=1 Tax=Abeliophyllum distichum TaxID=126358 RepID=A0ABD1QEB0_9LAMI
MMFLDVEIIEASEKVLDDITMKEATSFEDIDPRVTGAEPEILSVEELKSFLVDPSNPTKKLQVRKDFPEKPNEALKKFFYHNIDVFAWKHEDMVGIDLTVNFHRLNVDPKFLSHR